MSMDMVSNNQVKKEKLFPDSHSTTDIGVNMMSEVRTCAGFGWYRANFLYSS